MTIHKLCLQTLIFASVTVLAGAVQAGPTLDKVKQVGQISCGVPTGIAGFAAPDNQGRWSGFDID
ncbi:MAG: amino acid ABC transporter substrate-binding protein, partial [Acetobacteraceae bacterium]|nr:amino acid ABC transporter substrate-binding protein [Acetobacteraceae bacterium]